MRDATLDHDPVPARRGRVPAAVGRRASRSTRSSCASAPTTRSSACAGRDRQPTASWSTRWPDSTSAPLHALLADRSKLKILHAARQDLEVLLLGDRPVPAPGLRHADGGGAARLSGAGRLRGARGAAARASIDKGADAHRLVAPPAHRRSSSRTPPTMCTTCCSCTRSRERSRPGPRRWLAEDAAALEDRGALPRRARRRLAPAQGTGPACSPREQAARARARRVARAARDRARPAARLDPADEAIYAIATRRRARRGARGHPALPPAVDRASAARSCWRWSRGRASAGPPGIERERAGARRRRRMALVQTLQQVVRDEAAELGIAPEVLATRTRRRGAGVADRGDVAAAARLAPRGDRRDAAGRV